MNEAAALAESLRGAVGDERVLAAIAATPRDLFVPQGERSHAYDNTALQIACGQTISQPIVVARMLELLALDGSERVLDVGTGSGYHAALLAQLVAEVFSIERHAELSALARQALSELGIVNVTLIVGDGAAGLPRFAPFQAINVAAATGDDIPTPLVEQLADGGRLVAPVGVEDQRLIVLRRRGAELLYERHEPVRFVPLVSDQVSRRGPRRSRDA